MPVVDNSVGQAVLMEMQKNDKLDLLDKLCLGDNAKKQ